MLLFINIYIVW